ncbi:Kelch repeat-containing protein [Thermodesulfobacteriota bacterium]
MNTNTHEVKAASRLGYDENIVLPFDPIKGLWPEATYKYIFYSEFAKRAQTIYKIKIPPLLQRRMDHEAVVTGDGKIYVMGGRQYEVEEGLYGQVDIHYDKVNVLDTVECYDPQTNKWTYKTPMPSKRYLFAAVVGKDDRIYVIGGAGGWPYDENMPVLDTVDIYDPRTDSWSSGKPLPKPRESHAGVLGSDGKIYIMGGSTGAKNPPLNDLLIYDQEKNKWKRGPSMRKPRALLAAVSTPDGKIYAIGGTDVGAYEGRKGLNFFLPRSAELDTGQVQKTVEVLDITKRNLWD